VKNIVMCFDRTHGRSWPRDATNAAALLSLLDDTCPDRQITWRDPDEPRFGLREAAVEGARASIVDAYLFLVDSWEPDDTIFLFGVGRGAYCAQALARLLGTVGVLPAGSDNVLEYALSAYALPRARRTKQDWRRVAGLAWKLAGAGDGEIAVPVQFLGLWDTVKVPGLPRRTTAGPDDGALTNVVAGRHAVAIDGGYGPFGEYLVSPRAEHIEEVWFRGSHCDVAGGSGACRPLAGITLDWMLDGAAGAGAIVRAANPTEAPALTGLDALAEGAHTIPLRRLPANALVHASVEGYLRAHPRYWRRLPAQVVWADPEWVARSERLVGVAEAPAATVEPEPLTAVAS
jgi:uncharacterized protein (DUF2235 family)